MADAITIKALQDASLDAKSLEEVVNGDEAKQVTTRKGETYPSVKKAIKTMFENGGFPALPFNTKAKMTTDGASLADGDYAWVTDDTDANNGLYIKKSGVWVFSEFNVLKRVQDYVKRLDAKVMLDDASYLDIATDKNGDAYRYTDSDGGLHVVGLPESLQSSIKTLNIDSERIPNHLKDDVLHAFTDNAGSIVARIDTNADLHIAGDIYKDGIAYKSSGGDGKYIRAQNILLSKPRVKTLFPVATKNSDGLNKRMPFAIKTATGLVYFYHKQIVGFSGDGTGSEIWKVIISIDDSLTPTIVSNELFLSPDAPRGIVKHPMLGRTSDNRILLVFEKRLETTDPYTRYQCFSSDEGLTFTNPTKITPLGEAYNSSALGTTGNILTVKNNRLVVPMYTLAGQPYSMYSDDDGSSWNNGQLLYHPNGITQEPAIALGIDDVILMSLRTADKNIRSYAESKDNGRTWSAMIDAPNIQASANQPALFADQRVGAILQTHNLALGWNRDNFAISISYDNLKSFELIYKPYDTAWYGGYSQILKWKEGVYIIAIEYADAYTGLNTNENSGLLILSLSEVLSNVSYY